LIKKWERGRENQVGEGNQRWKKRQKGKMNALSVSQSDLEGAIIG